MSRLLHLYRLETKYVCDNSRGYMFLSLCFMHISSLCILHVWISDKYLKSDIYKTYVPLDWIATFVLHSTFRKCSCSLYSKATRVAI
jgi:hypothetical protein